MAKFYTGKDGRLIIDGFEQIKVTRWSLQAQLELLETTTLGDQQRSFTPGVQEFSGNASLLYYNDGTGRNDAATVLKRLVRVAGVSDTDAASIRLRFVEGNAVRDIVLRAYIQDAQIGSTVGEVSAAEISFQGTGALQSVTI